MARINPQADIEFGLNFTAALPTSSPSLPRLDSSNFVPILAYLRLDSGYDVAAFMASKPSFVFNDLSCSLSTL